MHHYSGDDDGDAGDAHDIDIDSDDRFRSVAGIGTASNGRSGATASAAAAPHPYHYVSDAALRTVVADRDPLPGGRRAGGGATIGTPKKSGPAEITDTGNLDDTTAHRMPGEWTTEVPQSSRMD